MRLSKEKTRNYLGRWQILSPQNCSRQDLLGPATLNSDVLASSLLSLIPAVSYKSTIAATVI